MKPFLLALQFLTIIPVQINKVKTRHIASSVAYFPLIGIFLGSCLIIINFILQRSGFNALTVDTLLVVALIVLTGGLHMDGLADTCDALGSGSGREKMLEIMRDSRIGAMGVLGIICVIVSKISLLNSMDQFLKPYALLLMCVLSRWGMVLEMLSFRYARQEGKAKDYIEGADLKFFVLATTITFVTVLAAGGARSIIAMAVVALAVFLLGLFFSKKFGGITGDTIGAGNEITELVSLVAIIGVHQGWLA